MNTKKITALALAALMAAGTTVPAFAADISTDKDEALVFDGAAAYEENDDGLLVLDDGVVNPGDSLYFLLKDGPYTGITDKERDRINVYADWKLGKEYIEDIDVIYKKGAVPTGKVEFTVNGVKLVANSSSASDIEAAIQAAYSTDLKSYIDGIVASDYAKNDGFKDSSKWYAADAYTVLNSDEGFVETSTSKYYSNEELHTAYVADAFKYTVDGSTVTSLYATAAAPSEKVGQANVNGSDGSTLNTEVTADTSGWVLTADTGKVYYMTSDATVDDLVSASLATKVNSKKIIDKTTRQEAVGVSEVSGTVYAKADGTLLTDENAAIAEVVKAEAAKVSTSAEKKNDYTYWVEVKTKEDITTKELDLAGTLYLGTTKNSAEKNGTRLPVDMSLTNRLYDSSKNFLSVEDEVTIDPDANGAVKFDPDAEEVTIYFGENEDAWFTFNAQGQGALNLAYTTKFNKEIADLFPKANIDFITWTAAPAANRTGDLYITADEDTFLYEVTEDGIKEVNGAKYDEDEGAWHIRTRKLASYVISDMELDTSVKLDNDSSSSTSSGSNTNADGDKPNPDTGR